jgi:hypothetical protein
MTALRANPALMIEAHRAADRVLSLSLVDIPSPICPPPGIVIFAPHER